MKTSRLLILALTTAFLSFNSCKPDSSEPKPNFILFITDDISYNDLGCYGNEFAKTPNLDKMASEGLLFHNTYLTASSCSPSRCSIITGRYPHNTGAPELHTELPDNQVMFPEILKKAGYYTVLSGKNHMGPAVQQAFDTISPGKGPGREEDWIELMQQRPKDQPFFFWFASTDAHRGWSFDSTAPVFQPDEVWVPPMLYDGPVTRKDLAGYYHEVSRSDYYMGEIMKELNRQGIAENTYVIYMTDNGRPFPRAKTRVYDSGMKTPFIVWKKGEIAPGETHSLTSSIDIAPTFFDLAGIDKPKTYQGISFVPVLDDHDLKVRDFAFAEHNWHVYRAHERMLRHNNLMYIRNAYPEIMNMCVESAPAYPAGAELWDAYEKGLTDPIQEDIFMVPRWKEELYDVKADPYQFNNLINDPQYAENIEALRDIMNEWIEETGDNVPEFPTPNREELDRTQIPGFERGEMPGDATGADTITASGPILEGI